jgi:hypothetical protein
LDNPIALPFFQSYEIKNARRLSGGRNNEAIRVETREGVFLLKRYVNPKDRLERFEREVAFLNHCKVMGITSVPKLLEQSHHEFAILQEYIEGLKPGTINSNHIEYAIKFINDINGAKGETFTSFSKAADFLDSGESMIANLRSRIHNIGDYKIASVLRDATFNNFQKALYEIQDFNHNSAQSVNLLLEKAKLISAGDFISPSDFGFHNSIESNRGVFFIDFEYSGIDSPLKLILDFAFQPDYLISESQAELLCDSIGNLYGFSFKDITREVKLLFALKWFMLILKRVFDTEPTRIDPKIAEEYFATRVEPLI